MKYISPKYEIELCNTEDIMASSRTFEVHDKENNDEVEYIISPESIFGF